MVRESSAGVVGLTRTYTPLVFFKVTTVLLNSTGVRFSVVCLTESSCVAEAFFAGLVRLRS